MESKDDNPSLVDLLYDDELDEEQADQLRAEIDEDPEAREELEAYESMLGRIRAEDSGPEVAGDLHDAIVDQAREHAGGAGAGDDAEVSDSQRAHDARPDRRPPTDPSSSGTGIWGRLTEGNTLSQMTIAAMALLAGGSVIYMLRARPIDKTSSPAESPAATSEAEVAFDETSSKYAPSTKEDEATGEWAPIAEQQVPEAEESKPTPEEAPSAAAKDRAPALAENHPKAPAPKKKRQRRAAPSRDDRAKSNEGPAQAPTAKNDTDKKSLDLFDNSKQEAPSPEGTTVFGAQKGADSDGESPTSTGSDSLADRQQKPAGDNESVGRLAMGGESQEEAAAGLQEQREADRSASAESEPRPTREPSTSAGGGLAADSLDSVGKSAKQRTAEASDQSQQEPSPREVEEAYRRDEFNQAVTLADRYLASDGVSGLQKARVLELKARALEQLGRTAEAHSVYTTLRRSHDSYKSDEIDRARRRTDAKRSKKTGDSAPQPSDEAASEQPNIMLE